jgi:hypothetical protein
MNCHKISKWLLCGSIIWGNIISFKFHIQSQLAFELSCCARSENPSDILIIDLTALVAVATP